jgi:hypothetical protein
LVIGEVEVGAALAYLEKRAGQMQYPRYQAAGWPIGSGMVESANKLVMQARLKGAGMHWLMGNLNPMHALARRAWIVERKPGERCDNGSSRGERYGGPLVPKCGCLPW